MSEDVVFSVENGLARVLLNRPQALNALTHEMCIACHAKLREWAADPQVKALVIRGAGDKAFCAGGDIRKLYEEGRKGGRYPYDFYHDEYRLNAAVHDFPKPYIALLDGIVMGGGVGLSVHGRHRIGTENTLFAMPETGIGLFPDVGGSYFLPRCPGRLGTYLALTGARLKLADALYAGIVTAHVPKAKLDALEQALMQSSADAIDSVIAEFARPTEPPGLAERRGLIDGVFGAPDLETVMLGLANECGPWAKETAATIGLKSPTSLKIALRQMQEGAQRDMHDCMRMEWRIVNRVIKGHDFYEGTRAVVIDKDQKPAWRPAGLASVSNADIDAYFAPLPDGDLQFD